MSSLKYWDGSNWVPVMGGFLPSTNSLVVKEIPIGAINGTNTTFSTSQPYIGGSLQVYVNGLAQSLMITETNPSTGVFDLSEAPLTGDDVSVSYMIAGLATGNADTVDSFHANATPTPNTLLPLDADGKLPIDILEEPLMVDVYRSVSQNVSDSTTATVLFDTEVKDTHDAYNPANGQFTVPEGQDGMYRITASARLISAGANTGVSFTSIVELNGTVVISNENTPYPAATTYGAVTLPMAKTLSLVANDVVRVRVWMDMTSGTGQVQAGANRSFLQIERIR